MTLLLLVLALALPATAQTSLALVVSAETAPAGAWAQIKVSLAAPQLVTAGYFSVDLDPQVFGSPGNVVVFSATGDAAGFAHVNGTHVDVTFNSPSGAVGQLPGLPVLAISVPVLPGVAAGRTSTVTVDPTGAVWTNSLGNSYTMAAASATFRVGGTLSVQSLSPAGGVVPAGGLVTVQGTGFDYATTVTIDGVSLSSVTYISPQQIYVTLGGSTELTSKHVRVTNSAGERADYFPSLPSIASGTTVNSPNAALIAPLTTFRILKWPNALSDHVNQYAGLLNPTSSPVAVTFFQSNAGTCSASNLQTVTVPAGALIYFALGHNVWWMTASAPIRALEYETIFEALLTPNEEAISVPTPATGLPGCPLLPQLPPGPVIQDLAAGSITVNWQMGTAPPAEIVQIPNPQSVVGISVSPSARTWLSASLTQGSPYASLTLSFDVSMLTTGTYTGTVTGTAGLPGALSGMPAPLATLQVVLNVSQTPFLLLAPSSPSLLSFNLLGGGTVPAPQSVSVASSGGAILYSASAVTASGGNWLSVTPSQGTTPATLSVRADTTGFAPYNAYQALIVIRGPVNSVNIPVTVYTGSPALGLPISFVLEAGSGTPARQGVSPEFGLVTLVTVRTQSGGNWLTGAYDDVTRGVTIAASAANLVPGTYQGTVTVSTTAGPPPVAVPVTLTVLGPPAGGGLTVTPAAISITAPAGQTATQDITIGSAAMVLVGWTASVAGASSTATLVSSSLVTTTTGLYPTPVAPAILRLALSAPAPGTYYGSVSITWDGGSAAIPVTFSVTAASGLPPVLAELVNAASEAPGAIAPGEVISVFGMGIGAAPAGLKLDAAGKVATQLGSTQVLIGGMPAPLVYASASQVNAIVPYEVATSFVTTVQVVSNGQQSAVWQLPVAASAPALFTIGSTGVGPAAALNQNSTVNWTTNPAARGEVVQLFATGGGQTAPASVTGGVAGSSGDSTLLPVTVTIGGADAAVSYRGSAPTEISGLLQVNATVPAGTAPGPAVPILITVGGRTSQSGVTIAVK